MEKDYDIKILRQFMLDGFSSQELGRLYREHKELKPVLYDLGESPSINDIIDKSIEYCERQLLFDLLISQLAELNPNRYRICEPELCKQYITKNNLKARLYDLDRKPHVDIFHQTLQHLPFNAPASFLIYGQPDCGQDLLVRRLISEIREKRLGREYEIVELHLARQGVRRDRFIWTELNRKFTKIHGSFSDDDFLSQFFPILEKRDIFIVIHEVETLANMVDWDIILLEFWHKIVNYFENYFTKNPTISINRLLLFLIDAEGKGSTWQNCRHDPTQYDFRYPMKLPVTNKFEERELAYWFNDIQMSLPKSITLPKLLEDTNNGLPHYIYDKMCELCQTFYEDIFPQGAF